VVAADSVDRLLTILSRSARAAVRNRVPEEVLKGSRPIKTAINISLKSLHDLETISSWSV
jgi:hypothetical protein